MNIPTNYTAEEMQVYLKHLNKFHPIVEWAKGMDWFEMFETCEYIYHLLWLYTESNGLDYNDVVHAFRDWQRSHDDYMLTVQEWKPIEQWPPFKLPN